MLNLEQIVEVWESLEPESSITDLVDAISRKYHIVNDVPLRQDIRYAMNAHQHLFACQNRKQKLIVDTELSKIITYEKFREAHLKFLEQADKNAKTNKSEGVRTPYGFSSGANEDNILGKNFSQHFGQGNASKTPYLNWYVVSIYYATQSSKIVLGIEEERYDHIGDMHPIKTEPLGNKNRRVAIFYESSRDCLDYEELYSNFMTVSQQVINLGLE